MKKKQLIINLISNIISFALQIGISFIITPIITEKVGNAAYGFIGLANNFISYASIFTVIINSMACRFITYEITRKNIKKANEYYSSVLIVDIIMSIIIAIISTIMIINLNKIINIPSTLDFDVKLTFALTFINLILSIIGTVFTVSTYVKNRSDIEATRNIIGNLIKGLFLIIIFSLLTPKIYYIAIGGVIFTIYIMLANINITKKLAPELKCDIKLYNKSCVKTLAKSGIWNSINNLSTVLLTGLDLLIANIFVGADAMGLLSIAKIIPTSIDSLLTIMANIFSPQFIILYSKHKIRELLKAVNLSTKMIAFIIIVPIAGFVVFGYEFFKLWLHAKTGTEILEIQILSILSLLPYIVGSNSYTLSVVDTTTNKLKRPAMATILVGLLSVLTTIIVLKTTNLGVYAVAGISSIYLCIKAIIFNESNAAKNLRIKWNAFLGQFVKNIVCLIIIAIIFIFIKQFIKMNTWMQFIKWVVTLGILGYIIAFTLIFNIQEKKKIFYSLKNKIKSI